MSDHLQHDVKETCPCGAVFEMRGEYFRAFPALWLAFQERHKDCRPPGDLELPIVVRKTHAHDVGFHRWEKMRDHAGSMQVCGKCGLQEKQFHTPEKGCPQ